MKKNNFYYPSIDGKTKIHGIRWEPEGEPKAILQIIHGMVEFIDRYNDFARFLTAHGYIVVGEDHLGHGESVLSDEYHGYFGEDGNAWVIADIHQLRLMMAEEFPKLPYLMLGHSMGSFLLRQYITEKDARYAQGLAGIIVMGTAWQPKIMAEVGKMLAKLLGTRKPGKTAKLIDIIGFRNNLKRIENPRTNKDWLTRDENIVDGYRANPWCSFHFSPNAYYHMFDGMQKAHDVRRMRKLPEGLPILFAAGAEDPVGNWGEGVRKAFMVYSENTPCDVDIMIYGDDRHEILNELDKDRVYEDMKDFLDYCLDKNGK
ncbi:MAG: alpha/beta hydrolase [Mogibacterium sp.]|nr:alpha/beta hydrolase [Mogibacterium sp.]